jgi:hypothetical protein
MKQLICVFIFSILFIDGYCQFYNHSGVRIRFPCDTCPSNHNPLAYQGGNILSADIVNSPDGKYLKLVSGPSIDTNVVPAYFDIYGLLNKGSDLVCTSTRIENFGLDLSNFGQFEFKIKASINYAGFRGWLASSSGNPAPGESTYQTDPNNSNSEFLVQSGANTSLTDIHFNLDSNTPVWKDWSLRFNVNMFGFTALTPNTEYDLYEININYPVVSRLAFYDCLGPGAVMNETLKDKIKIYPLPASENINFDIPNEYQNCHIELYSDLGKLVEDGIYSGTTSLSIGDLPRGI